LIEINVAHLLKAPVGTTQTYAIDDIVNISDNDIPVQGEVNLTRSGRGILVRSTIQTEMELTCSRCLRLFRCPLTLNIEEEFFPTIDIITGISLPPPDESGAFTIDRNNILDLTEAIRQYCLLAVPMKPLCQEDCAGLCPTCGVNLNQTSCSCQPEPVDSRWAKLSNLKTDN
jgi:uncharacterized protein